MKQSQNNYIVVPAGKGQLHIVNMLTGSIVGNIRTQGELIGSPVVAGSQVSIVVKDSQGHFLGIIYKLPSGSLISQYSV